MTTKIDKCSKDHYEYWQTNKASWIWTEGESRPKNGYVQFRRAFSLEAAPAKADIHISADCRYRLYVNGIIIGHGPVTTAPEYKQVDVYDVAAHLQPGENVIAALVLHRQNPTSRLIPVRGGLILQCDSSDLSLGSDGDWKARWAAEYQEETPYMTHQYGNQEWVDGRKAPVGWQSVGFDDSAWENAVVVKNAADHWPEALELRRVPHIRREIVHPSALVSFFGLSTGARPPEDDPDPAWNLMLAYPLSSVVAWHAENIMHPENGPSVFQENQGNGVGFVVDLGTECYGYPFIDIECPAGTMIDIGHGEILGRNRIQTVLMPKSGAEQLYADRYIAHAGRQRFEIFDTKGCRYLEIHCNRVADFYTGAKVIVHEVGIVNRRSPMPPASEFQCSDERLTQIWNICRHTAEVKCQDWHICDAQREQNNWPEIFQDMLYWQCFGKIEMVRQMIHQFCRAQLADGFILHAFPVIGKKPITEYTRDDLYFFPTAMFPLIVYLDWLYGGEDDRQAYWLDCCARAYGEILKYVGPHGTLANLPGTQWVEWTGLDARDPGRGVEREWEMPAWNAVAVLVLDRMAEMAEGIGQPERASNWRQEAQSIRAAASARYWSEDRQAYPDGIYDGEVSSSVSQSTNALAVLAGLGNDAQRRAAMATALDPARCDVPSGMNMMALLHEALQSLDMDAGVPDRIRRKWGVMLDHGATTTWEGEEALERHQGLCFGFGGHPLNYLARTALGVVPLEPGYRRFSVCLKPHDLTHAQGRIATGHGAITVDWKQKDGGMDLNLTVPAGCEAVVTAPRIHDGQQLSTMIVNGKEAKMEMNTVASCTFSRKQMPVHVLEEGKHSISFQ